MKLIILVGLLVPMIGCTYYLPPSVSSTSLGPKEKPVMIKSGRSSSYYVLFFGPFGDNSLEAAINDAVGKNGDTMINVFVDRKMIFFPFPYFSLFTVNDTMVHGTIIKYTDDIGIYREPKSSQVSEQIQVERGGDYKQKIREVISSLKDGQQIKITTWDNKVIDGKYEGILKDNPEKFKFMAYVDGNFTETSVAISKVKNIELVQ